MTMLLWWGLLFGLCILLELSSPGYFFFLSFSIGAFVALVSTWFGVSLKAALVIFLGVSVVSFILLRYYASWLVHKKKFETNVYALPGKKGVVLSQIDPFARGWVKLDGEVWAAMSQDETSIEKDAVIEVMRSLGSHVIVKKIDETL